jgi:hypothetical protein
MAKDAKIGSLIGLVLIFIVAFVINGFTRSGNTRDRSEVNSDMSDNTSNIHTPTHDVANRLDPPIPQFAEEDLPPEEEENTGSDGLLPPTESTATEPVIVEDTSALESDTSKPSLSEVVYAVCEGDNLADIAKKFYGAVEGNKRANVLRIFLANQKVLTSPHELFVGQKIVIPPLESVRPDGSLFSHSMFETVQSIGRSHLSTQGRTLQQSRLYAVKEGDSLWNISATLLGDGRRYREISKLNSGVLMNENELAVGMRLRIPAQ